MANGKIPTPHAIDLLWQNSNPSASFSPQTVAVDLTGYSLVMVVSQQGDTAVSKASMLVPNTLGTTGRVVHLVNYRQVRSFEIVSTGIRFGEGQEGSPSANVSTNDARAIPVFIYGIK